MSPAPKIGKHHRETCVISSKLHIRRQTQVLCRLFLCNKSFRAVGGSIWGMSSRAQRVGHAHEKVSKAWLSRPNGAFSGERDDWRPRREYSCVCLFNKEESGRSEEEANTATAAWRLSCSPGMLLACVSYSSNCASPQHEFCSSPPTVIALVLLGRTPSTFGPVSVRRAQTAPYLNSHSSTIICHESAELVVLGHSQLLQEVCPVFLHVLPHALNDPSVPGWT